MKIKTLPSHSLSPLLKKAVALLSFGTFLEYADLMLYVHMGVLLNELFFDINNPQIMKWVTAASITTTFAFRPLGAWIFGKIGDNFGRTIVLSITTMIMGGTCVIMANLPTYAQIGISASVGISLCRILQSISSVGEITSCDLYLMETSRPPIQYPLSGITSLFGALGGTFALGIASLVTTQGFDWRLAFWIGGIVAIVGMQARKSLVESHDFSSIKYRIDTLVETMNISVKEAKNLVKNTEKHQFDKKVLFALFIIQAVFPLYYYFIYIHCGILFKNLFNYSSTEIIHHNFFISLLEIFGIVFLMVASYYIHPLRILKIQLVISAVLVILLPFLLNNVSEPYQLTLIQVGITLFSLHGLPAFPIFYKHIPILKRFTSAGLQYSLGRGFMFVITSFGLIYLTEWCGHFGLSVLFIPTLIGYTIALFFFDKREKALEIQTEVEKLEKLEMVESELKNQEGEFTIIDNEEYVDLRRCAWLLKINLRSVYQVIYKNPLLKPLKIKDKLWIKKINVENYKEFNQKLSFLRKEFAIKIKLMVKGSVEERVFIEKEIKKQKFNAIKELRDEYYAKNRIQ